MKYTPLLIVCLLASGCAGMKAKNRSIFCVGVCVSSDTDMDKKKGELPAKPAPEAPKQD